MSRNLKAKTIARKVIELHDIVTRTVDTLDFPDRIIKWEIGYGHLVVATTNQVHIYNEKYTNTPLAIIDGRSDVKVLILAKKYVRLRSFFFQNNPTIHGVILFPQTGTFWFWIALQFRFSLILDGCI